MTRIPGCRRAYDRNLIDEDNLDMASERQRAAARKNIKKAASVAKRKRTIANLPKKTRTALAKQAAKVARKKRTS
jgi:hypothetical protein